MTSPAHTAQPPSGVATRRRGPGLARLLVLVTVVACGWLAVPPARSYLETQQRAAETQQQVEQLRAEQRQLEAQSRELSRGSGLEEQARRQGLIAPTERSYVVKDLPQP